MTYIKPFTTFVKNNQSRFLSKTWHDRIAEKEVEKNNFLAIGNIKLAKKFASAVVHYSPSNKNPIDKEPIVIFSKDMLKEEDIYLN